MFSRQGLVWCPRVYALKQRRSDRSSEHKWRLRAEHMGSSEESIGGDAFDMVLYLFVLGPAVEWCLKSKRVNGNRPGSRRGITLAVLLLGAVAAARLAGEMVGRQENMFSVLGLRVDASTADIKKAYKTISLKYHPDKVRACVGLARADWRSAAVARPLTPPWPRRTLTTPRQPKSLSDTKAPMRCDIFAP